MKDNRLTFTSFLMWLLPLSFFTYQFILRLFPSLVMQKLMEKFTIDATAFGFLASAYYYGYSLMQIPLAMAIDRYGPRYVILLCVTVCASANYTFGYTDNWYLLLLSRFLIGAASGVAFIGTSKVISEWFPKSHYSKMVGFTFTIGLMGAVYGGKPLSKIISLYDWQEVVFILSMIALFLTILIYLFLRLPQNSQNVDEEQKLKFGDFKNLLSSSKIWFLALANFLMVGALEGFADIWGVNYLMTVYQYSKDDSAQMCSLIFIGMIFGSPLIAILGRIFGNYKVICFCGFGISIAFYFLIVYPGIFSEYLLMIIFFVIGIMCCYQVVVFAAGNDMTDHNLVGVTIIAFLNSMNMLGGSFFHSIIGYIMDYYWNGTMQGSIRIYDANSFNYGLAIIPICAFIGGLIIVFIGLQNQKQKIIHLAN